ncbi:MAG TPA: TPM domain-containing protein [Hanamia sp.]|nr:TPM domain-containing protein [Hanamia sp.]
MRILFTFIILFGFNSLAAGQSEQDSCVRPTMTPSQLLAYRQFIWDSVPAAVGWVNDYGLLFKKEQKDSLERLIARFEKKTSVEIMVVTIDSFMVDRKNINEFSYRLMKLWGIGKISKSNGMVICISKDEKKIYISADYGIDKFMSEYDRQKIINKYFIPFYNKDNYFEGTFAGLNAIQDRIIKKWKKYNKEN